MFDKIRALFNKEETPTEERKNKMTNGDRIRQMDDDELVKFIRATKCVEQYGDDSCGYPFCIAMNGCYCVGIENGSSTDDEDILKWLKEEYK